MLYVGLLERALKAPTLFPSLPLFGTIGITNDALAGMEVPLQQTESTTPLMSMLARKYHSTTK